MRDRKIILLIASASLLCSCANPYSSLYDESSSKIAEDTRFVEEYRNTICSIKEEHGHREITGGKCLALYYDYKDQKHIENEKEEVVERVGYILEHPDKFESTTYDLLSKATMEIAECKNYIIQNCM